MTWEELLKSYASRKEGTGGPREAITRTLNLFVLGVVDFTKQYPEFSKYKITIGQIIAHGGNEGTTAHGASSIWENLNKNIFTYGIGGRKIRDGGVRSVVANYLVNMLDPNSNRNKTPKSPVHQAFLDYWTGKRSLNSMMLIVAKVKVFGTGDQRYVNDVLSIYRYVYYFDEVAKLYIQNGKVYLNGVEVIVPEQYLEAIPLASGRGKFGEDAQAAVRMMQAQMGITNVNGGPTPEIVKKSWWKEVIDGQISSWGDSANTTEPAKEGEKK